MKDTRVGLLLTVTIFVMAAVPMAAAFHLLHDTLRTSLNLGFNPQIVRTLQNSSDNLRALGKLDETNRATYRAQFDEVEELKQVYSEPDVIKQRLLDSLRLYFGLGLGVVVLLSLAVATLLSRRIARSHAPTSRRSRASATRCATCRRCLRGRSSRRCWRTRSRIR